MTQEYFTRVIPKKKSRSDTKVYVSAQENKELIEISDAASVLFTYYISKSGIEDFPYHDSQAATSLGWKESKVKRIRQALAKAKWFKQVNLRNQVTGLTATVTYLGKDACSKVETPEEFTKRKQMESGRTEWLKERGYESLTEFKAKASPEQLQELLDTFK